MVYESSYESGRKPHHPDLSRGRWEKPSDFLHICWGFALKMDIFAMSWVFFFELGTLSLIPYLICITFCIVPLMVIHFFMGQFSSSSFITAFRVSPFFKGMGYVALTLNVVVLSYYTIFATIPFLFLLNSLRPTLPWSCEGLKSWAHKLDTEEQLNLCNLTVTNQTSAINPTSTIHTDTVYSNSSDSDPYTLHHIPSSLYVRYLFNGELDFHICWEMFGITLLLWGIIAYVFYKFNDTAKLGRFLRYTLWAIVVLMLVCLTRFYFLPGASNGLKNFVAMPKFVFDGVPSTLIYATSAFGAGWGALVSLASVNSFKTNIMQYSWIIAFGQMAIYMVFGLTTFMLEEHFFTITEERYSLYLRQHWVIYLFSGSALASMRWANLWSILFYTMLLLAALIVMVTQIFSILLSIFDEFETLRTRKQEVTFGFIGAVAILSLYFSSNKGLEEFVVLAADTIFTQVTLNLLLILVILWIYGRERFQRDIEFMLSQQFSTWKVNIVRFVTPLCLILTLLLATDMAYLEHYFSTIGTLIFAFLFLVLPWLFVPGYGIFIMSRSIGPWLTRFRRACRPTDWYPMELEDRQRYEQSMGNMDITQQLNPSDINGL